MPLRKTVKDIMIPIQDYAVIDPEATLQEAIRTLRGSYCRLETGACSHTGHRTILVVDASGNLVGVLNFRSILKVLVPEVAGTLMERLESLEVSVVYAQAGAENLDESHEDVVARVSKNAQVKVKEIMLKNRAHIDSQTSLLDALKLVFRKKLIMLPVYENNRLIGVVREADLFITVADMVIAD
jgi:CBS domain-containing protein